MGMSFEELDDATRRCMIEEFESEELGGRPYRGKDLSTAGLAVFPDLMREAMAKGDDDSLFASMAVASYWKPTETYVLKGVARERKVNIGQAAERLARSEFNTWYVRGLCRRLMDEGVEQCQSYRAALPKWEPADCSSHEGQVFLVADIYRGHRARYWPEPGDPNAFSIPFQPGCHHTIRRLH